MDSPSPAHAEAAFAVLIIVVIEPRTFHPDKGLFGLPGHLDPRKEMKKSRSGYDGEWMTSSI